MEKAYLLGILISFSLTVKCVNLPIDDTIGFIENKGQIHDQNYIVRKDILYSSRENGIMVFLRRGGFSYQLYGRDFDELSNREKGPTQDKDRSSVNLEIHRIDVSWIGSNNSVIVKKGKQKKSYFNFYLPSCPEGLTGVGAYSDLTYTDLYPGIDLKWYHREGNLKYDYILHPNSDPSQIKLMIEGPERIEINRKGHLILHTAFGDIEEEPPMAIQDGMEIRAEWILNGNIVQIKLGEYDAGRPLVIDPLIRSWGTYFGSLYNEFFLESVMDDSMNVILCGRTTSAQQLATSGAFQTVYQGNIDYFVSKFTKDGVLKWATYYGGKGTETFGGCAVDGNYNIFLAGSTLSDSGITTPLSYQSTFAGSGDALLVKFDQSGGRLWATYFGGSSNDAAYDCETDGSGNVYIVGNTNSSSSIASAGAHQFNLQGVSDAFIAKFNSSGNRLWSSYLGGTGDDLIQHCARDFQNNIYVTGRTSSSNSISTSGSHQVSFGGSFDAFVVKFSSNGIRKWGTYYGGSNNDFGNQCHIDNAFNIYIAGETWSSNNIASNGAHKPFFSGLLAQDAFLVKLDSSGVRQWGTYYGTTSTDVGLALTVDASLHVYLTGQTWSPDSIATVGSFQSSIGSNSGGDAYLVKFDANGQREWGTYYGGNGADFGGSCFTVPSTNEIYLSGQTSSNNTNAISTPGSHQNFKGGGPDAFVVKFNLCDHVYDTVYPKTCTVYHSPGGNLYDSSGTYLETLPKEDGCDSLLTIILTVNSLDTSVSQQGDTLTSNAPSVSYQWVDCDSNHRALPGDTNVQFIAPRNGSFAVIVSQDTCIDTSACHMITGVGIATIHREEGLELYPIPSSDVLWINSSKVFSDYVIFNLQGVRLKQGNIREQKIDVGDLQNGMYLLELSDGKNWVRRKFLVRQ